MFTWNSEAMIQWIIEAVKFGTVILLGSIGEIITEKVGNLNLGIPGIMFLGAISGFSGMYYYETYTENPNAFVCIALGVGLALLAGILGGMLYAFLTTSLRANQNVTGLTLTTFGVGIAIFFGLIVTKSTGKIVARAEFADSVFNTKIPWLSTELGDVGRILFSYGFIIYLAIAIAFVAHFILTRTKIGLNLRAIGENPATADAAGINVTKYKYIAICGGCGISALGGLQYVLKSDGTWSSALDIEGMGWLAVALVIFAAWKTPNAIWGAFLFGFLYKAESYASSFITLRMPTYFAFVWRMVPYAVTIIVLIVASFRKKRDNQPPSHLGLSYFREER